MAKEEAVTKKVRLVINETEDGPLTQLQNRLRERGVKAFDLNEVVAEALDTIEQSWWDEKLEQLTPLEFKLQSALNDPEMRAQLVSLLEKGGAGEAVENRAE